MCAGPEIVGMWQNEVIDNTNEKPTNCVALEIYSIEAIMWFCVVQSIDGHLFYSCNCIASMPPHKPTNYDIKTLSILQWAHNL